MKITLGDRALAKQHPEVQETCKSALRQQLAGHRQQPSHLNGFLIAGVVHLGASEEMALIREAFQDGNVDLSIMGDLEQVEIKLGLRTERSAPRPKSWLSTMSNVPSPGPQQTRRDRKVGRNEPCPCGSGMKYKRCCGRR